MALAISRWDPFSSPAAARASMRSSVSRRRFRVAFGFEAFAGFKMTGISGWGASIRVGAISGLAMAATRRAIRRERRLEM